MPASVSSATSAQPPPPFEEKALVDRGSTSTVRLLLCKPDLQGEEFTRPPTSCQASRIAVGLPISSPLKQVRILTEGAGVSLPSMEPAWKPREGVRGSKSRQDVSSAIHGEGSPDRRRTAQYTVTRVLAEAETLENATPRILSAVCEGLGWDVGALWTVDHGVLRCVGVWQAP